MTRGRTIKFPPKRGKLTRNQAKRIVEKVVYGEDGAGKVTSPKSRSSRKLLLKWVVMIERADL